MLLCLAGIGFKFWLKLVRKSKKAEVWLNVSEIALSIKMESTKHPGVQNCQRLCWGSGNNVQLSSGFLAVSLQPGGSGSRWPSFSLTRDLSDQCVVNLSMSTLFPSFGCVYLHWANLLKWVSLKLLLILCVYNCFAFTSRFSFTGLCPNVTWRKGLLSLAHVTHFLAPCCSTLMICLLSRELQPDVTALVYLQASAWTRKFFTGMTVAMGAADRRGGLGFSHSFHKREVKKSQLEMQCR